MLNTERTRVYCNSFECIKMLHLPPHLIDQHLPAALTDLQLRKAIIANGWLIDLTSNNATILVGQEERVAIAPPPWDQAAYDDQQLTTLFTDEKFEITRDKHYCSLECAQADA